MVNTGQGEARIQAIEVSSAPLFLIRLFFCFVLAEAAKAHHLRHHFGLAHAASCWCCLRGFRRCRSFIRLGGLGTDLRLVSLRRTEPCLQGRKGGDSGFDARARWLFREARIETNGHNRLNQMCGGSFTYHLSFVIAAEALVVALGKMHTNDKYIMNVFMVRVRYTVEDHDVGRCPTQCFGARLDVRGPAYYAGHCQPAPEESQLR